MTSSLAGALLLAGAVVFFVGVSIGVPRVWTEPDVDKRARMLAAHPVAWRVGQAFIVVGTVVAGAGVGPLAAEAEVASRTLLAVSCGLLVAGALCWSPSLYRRALHPHDFAHGRQPGGPWVAYVWLTLAGLLLLGVGLVAGDAPGWLGWVVLGADVLFAAAYLRFHDIPPFVFYLLLVVVGVTVL